VVAGNLGQWMCFSEDRGPGQTLRKKILLVRTRIFLLSGLHKPSVPGEAFWRMGGVVARKLCPGRCLLELGGPGQTLRKKILLVSTRIFLLSGLHKPSVPGDAFWRTGGVVARKLYPGRCLLEDRGPAPPVESSTTRLAPQLPTTKTTICSISSQ
jgi:hypothetical protein